ncbi:MAG TPA: heme-binding protein [Polyangia bacterium]|nr:heme-binding protein [Polyangia bacterium]
MKLTRVLDHADATRICRGIVAAAASDGGLPVTAAVAGADGVPLALERMDGAPALGVNVVIAKLHTAIVGLKDTIERHGKGVDPADYNDPRITTFGGGVVLRHDGHVFGAIAVSGRKPEDDHRLADAARRSLAS